MLRLQQKPCEGQATEEQDNVVVAACASLVKMDVAQEVDAAYEKMEQGKRSDDEVHKRPRRVVRQVEAHEFDEAVGQQRHLVGAVAVGEKKAIGSDDAQQRSHPDTCTHRAEYDLCNPTDGYEMKQLGKYHRRDADGKKREVTEHRSVWALVGSKEGIEGDDAAQEDEMGRLQFVQHDGRSQQNGKRASDHAAVDAQQHEGIVQFRQQINTDGTRQEAEQQPPRQVGRQHYPRRQCNQCDDCQCEASLCD